MKKQIQAKSYSYWISNLLAWYYQIPDHPFKLRLISWLETLLGNKRILIKTKSGFLFAIDRQDYIQKTVFETRDWEPEIGKILEANLKKDDVFYDIGANAGYFSCFVLKHNIEKVISFEPSLEMQKLFRLNMSINTFNSDLWSLQTCALSDQGGQAIYQPGPSYNTGLGKLITDSSLNNNNIDFDLVYRDRELSKVDTNTLDNLVFNCNFPFPTIIKLDTEGHEGNILTGARQLLSEAKPRLIIFEAFCDTNLEIIDSNLVQILEKNNYKIQHIARNSGICEKNENYVAYLQSNPSLII
jgi:FkbM family methyltransferase